MTAAVVDGDPPLPPEHTLHATCASDNPRVENESKHPDTSFISSSKPPGTESYGVNPVAKSNGRCNSDHEPSTPLQLRSYHRPDTDYNGNNAPLLPSSHSPNTKNTKTNHTTNTIERVQTTTRRTATTLPPAAINSTTPHQPLPSLTSPQSIELDALLTNFIALLRQNKTTSKTTQQTTTQKPMTTMPTTPNNKATATTIIHDPPAIASTLNAPPLMHSITAVAADVEDDLRMPLPMTMRLMMMPTNGHRDNDHEKPPPQQPRPHHRTEAARQTNDYPCPSHRSNNTKNIKTSHTTNPNGRDHVGRDPPTT